MQKTLILITCLLASAIGFSQEQPTSFTLQEAID